MDVNREMQLEWALKFKQNRDCETCYFIKKGIGKDCESVCLMLVEDIVEYMERSEGV